MFSVRGLRLYFSALEPWVALSALLPRGSSRFICGAVGSASCRTACPFLPPSASCLAASPLCPSCRSLPLLLVWMNVSSLSPWLSDFHTVRFSVSSGCFLFLNCCPFDCVRRQSVSTYASILARSSITLFLDCVIFFRFLCVL